MDAENSRKGLTYVLKADSLIFLLYVWMFLLINFRVLLPLVVSWLMCLVHDKSSEILTVRYLTFLLIGERGRVVCNHARWVFSESESE